MRMSRFDWVAQFFPRRKVRPRAQAAAKVRQQPPRWFVDLPGVPPLTAFTKSEARAMAKKHLGLERLPAHVHIAREVLSR